MEVEFKKKVSFKREIKCPHCGFLIEVEAGKKIKTPTVKAETEEYCTVEKSSHTKLEAGKDIDEEAEEKESK